MNEGQLAIFWMIIGTISLFIMLFGFRYMSNKENMAMIDKGINFKDLKVRPAPFRSLKWALLLVGVGGGLFAAYMFHTFVVPFTSDPHNDGVAFVYFGLIIMGGGLGLFRSYQIERTWWDKEEEKEERRNTGKLG